MAGPVANGNGGSRPARSNVNWGGICFEGYGTVPSRAPVTSSVWISSGSFAWDLCD
ncbi:hypothetical protein ACN28C_30885 [Plantactinospora sp. WMMC1484]|uniref:hypothetical protein n=1 Tax=Plantactinospora sp. WMMC1484 TaxID=3404122 RepID=UPI003BF50F7F